MSMTELINRICDGLMMLFVGGVGVYTILFHYDLLSPWVQYPAGLVSTGWLTTYGVLCYRHKTLFAPRHRQQREGGS